MKAITIGYKPDGTSELLAGTEVPAKDQRRTVHRYRSEGLPEGFDRVEVWARGTAVIKQAVRPGAAEPGAEPQPAEKPAKPKKQKKAEKSKAAEPQPEPDNSGSAAQESSSSAAEDDPLG